MAQYPYTITENSISVFVDGAMHIVPKDHAGFLALREHLKLPKHDAELIRTLADKKEAIARLTMGAVRVVGNTVYFEGSPIHGTLSDRIVKMLDEGFSPSPLVHFLENLMQNPNPRSREQTYDFVSRWNAPLTEDGCFIAFKGVRDDYTDVHTGTFDNSPGRIVKINREDCDDDPNRTCSRGLHVCASHYLDTFWTNYRVIAVKVNPRDVVAVPVDYSYSKMRVCEYLVLGDIVDERHRNEVESYTVATAREGHIEQAEISKNFGYISPEGYEAIPDDPKVGDLVVRKGSDEVGTVISIEKIDIYDSRHPDYYVPEWAEDEDECPDVYAVTVEFPTYIAELVLDEYEMFGDNPGIRGIMVVQPEAKNADEDEAEMRTFYHAATGQTFTQQAVLDIVDEIGQRGFAREYNVPRTTVQEWLKAIRG